MFEKPGCKIKELYENKFKDYWSIFCENLVALCQIFFVMYDILRYLQKLENQKYTFRRIRPVISQAHLLPQLPFFKSFMVTFDSQKLDFFENFFSKASPNRHILSLNHSLAPRHFRSNHWFLQKFIYYSRKHQAFPQVRSKSLFDRQVTHLPVVGILPSWSSFVDPQVKLKFKRSIIVFFKKFQVIFLTFSIIW